MDTKMEAVEDTITCRGTCDKKVWPKHGRSNFLTHITRAKKCKILYTTEEIEEFKKLSYLQKKKRQIETYDENEKNKKLERQRKSYGKNSKKNLERQRKTYDAEKRNRKYNQNRKKVLKQQQLKYNSKPPKPPSTMKERLLKFAHECKYGPIFVCVCCMRLLFKRGANKITNNFEEQLFGSQMIDYLQTEIESEDPNDNLEIQKNRSKSRKLEWKQNKRLKESLKVHGAHYICCSCRDYLEKTEMPPRCAKNNLEYQEIPDCLQLSNLERQLICKDLVFIKIRQLRPTRMDAMNDHVINVPIEDDDIIKTVMSLPRTEKNNGMVTVGLKRDMKYSNFHKLQMIRPEKVYEALLYLKDNHPSYKDIIIPSLHDWKKEMSDRDEDTLKESTVGSDANLDDEMSGEETEQRGRYQLPNQSEENVFNSTTCLYSENPLADVIGKFTIFFNCRKFLKYMLLFFLSFFFLVNTSNKPMRKLPKRNGDIVHVIAPGQRKKLSNWLSEEDHDINAFPDLFPNGRCGLNDAERTRKISPGQNYSQKVLNVDPRFSQDPDFIFIAQQSLEKHRFENQISISCQRGVLLNGSEELKSNKAIDVFKDIPGTPSYWKKVRNDLFARMEQLGPFHFFFTLSAAEMHWPEVATSVLHSLGNKISYEAGWEEDETKIKIEDVSGVSMSLPEYKKRNIRNKTEYFKKHFLLITRIFDNKVKAFIALLKATGKIDNYTYRIEFQIRGMPHLHGVFWLKEEEIKPCKDENGKYIDEKVAEMIDTWISCSLDTGNKELDKLVAEVNVHGHTNSCQKGKQAGCRFNFPKLPSRRTLIAYPISPDLDDEEKKIELKRSKDILNKVKNRLEELSNEDIDNLDNSLDHFLKELDIDIEAYEKALTFSERGKVVVLKRTLKERNVNNYNMEFMLAWRANLDIQFCYDGFAIVTYLTDYITKTDAGVTKALQKSVNESKDCNDFDRLNNMKRAYFTQRQVSASEAVYRLIDGLHLTASSVKSKFVATGFPENRSGFYKKVTGGDVDEDEDNENEDDDDEMEWDVNFEDNCRTINIPGREGNFKKVSEIHVKYANRPDHLEKMCLAQFATTYNYSTKPANVIFSEGVSGEKGCLSFYGTKEKVPKYIRLKKNGYMQARNSPFIMRIHSSKKKKADEGKYSELLLYFPWRSEAKLREGFNDTFNVNYDIIMKNKQQIYPNSNMIDEMRDILENNDDTRPKHLCEMIDPAGEQENLDDMEIQEPLDTSEFPQEESAPINVKSVGLLFKKIEVQEHDVLLNMARSLSFEQRIAFDLIVQFCKSISRLKKGAKIRINAPNIIVTGKCLHNITLAYIQFFLYLNRWWRCRKKSFDTHNISMD